MGLYRERLCRRIIGAAIEVHRCLGPGLLESAYRACLVHELKERGTSARAEVPMPLVYKGAHMPLGYRLDIVVEQTVIVEIKAVKLMLPVHEAQLLSYLKISGLRVGLLINFHGQLLRTGIKRMVL